MNEFEVLLVENMNSLERLVNYKISNRQDAQDIIQDVCLTAAIKFDSVKDKTLFKAWLIRIAINKCNDYFRQKSKIINISYESLAESDLTSITETALQSSVNETLELLDYSERQILYLYYFQELSQKEIAKILNLPLGTVKSRMYYAKQKFKENYPYHPERKDNVIMKKLPEYLPEYKIETSEKTPFDAKCEELTGWATVPRLGECTTFGLYYSPSRKMQGWIETKVIGEAEIYGIRGVEIVAKEHEMENYYRTEITKKYERRFIAQLTDTHSRFLAETHIEDGVRMVHTFIDDDEFTENWGYGEDNCGTPIQIKHQNLIDRQGNRVTGTVKPEVVDIVGRYNVIINGKTYDTVCVMDLNCFNDTVVSEQYIDKNGRTVLWRRFNRNNWAFNRYGKTWSEMLPDNEQLIVNGEIYVHWYDSITDYIL